MFERSLAKLLNHISCQTCVAICSHSHGKNFDAFVVVNHIADSRYLENASREWTKEEEGKGCAQGLILFAEKHTSVVEI